MQFPRDLLKNTQYFACVGVSFDPRILQKRERKMCFPSENDLEIRTNQSRKGRIIESTNLKSRYDMNMI